MLKAFKDLANQTDGRYATDEELQFIHDYVKTYALRLNTYQKIQQVEQAFVDTAHQQITVVDPTLLRSGKQDLTAKWKRDTLRVLRYSAIALLLDDADIHRERFLYWFQTIMRAFSAQRSCDVTYTIMQDVAKRQLAAREAELLCPILELNRVALGTSS